MQSDEHTDLVEGTTSSIPPTPNITVVDQGKAWSPRIIVMGMFLLAGIDYWIIADSISFDLLDKTTLFGVMPMGDSIIHAPVMALRLFLGISLLIRWRWIGKFAVHAIVSTAIVMAVFDGIMMAATLNHDGIRTFGAKTLLQSILLISLGMTVAIIIPMLLQFLMAYRLRRALNQAISEGQS